MPPAPERLDDLVVTESTPDHGAIPARETQIVESELETYCKNREGTTGGAKARRVQRNCARVRQRTDLS